MKQLIVIAFLLVSLTDTVAQNINNLVVNPSFELLRNDSCLRRGHASISEFPGWYDTGVLFENPNGGGDGRSSPDAFHRDTCEMRPFWNSSVPLNSFGFQQAQHGIGYAGFAYGGEYISGTLLQKLIVGNTYCINLYVNLAEASRATTRNLKLMLHTDSVLLRFHYVPNGQSQADSEVLSGLNPLVFESSYLTDTLRWMKLETHFIADSAYRYFTFGNLRPLIEMDVKITRPEGTGQHRLIYFYLDNVSIYDCSDTISPPEPTFAFEVKAYPNPASDWFNFDYTLPEAGKVRIHVTDVFGKIVLARTELQGQKGVNTFAIDASPWAMGRYHISVLYEANGRSEYRHLKQQIIR